MVNMFCLLVPSKCECYQRDALISWDQWQGMENKYAGTKKGNMLRYNNTMK
jgi:hypothetical protein